MAKGLLKLVHAAAFCALGSVLLTILAFAEPDPSTLKGIAKPKATASITPKERAFAYRKQLGRLAAGFSPDPIYFRKLEILYGEHVYFVPLPSEIEFDYCEQSNEEEESFELKCLTHVGLLSVTFRPWPGSIMEMIGRSADRETKLGFAPGSTWKCGYEAHSSSYLLRSASKCTAFEENTKLGTTSFRTWIQPLEAKTTVLIRVTGEAKYAEARRQLAGVVAHGTAYFVAGGTEAEGPALAAWRKRDPDVIRRIEARRMNLGRAVASEPIRQNDVAEQGSPLAADFLQFTVDSSLPKQAMVAGENFELRANRVMKSAVTHAEYAPVGESDAKLWKKRFTVRFWKNSLLSLTDYAREVAASTEARMANGDPVSDYAITKTPDGKSVFVRIQYADRHKNVRFAEHSVYRAFRVPNGLVSFQWAERTYPKETLAGDEALRAFLKAKKQSEPEAKRSLSSAGLPLPELAREGM